MQIKFHMEKVRRHKLRYGMPFKMLIDDKYILNGLMKILFSRIEIFQLHFLSVECFLECKIEMWMNR